MSTLKIGTFNIDGNTLRTAVNNGYVNIILWSREGTPIRVSMSIWNAKTHGVIKQMGRQICRQVTNPRYKTNATDRTKLRDFLIKNEAYITTP